MPVPDLEPIMPSGEAYKRSEVALLEQMAFTLKRMDTSMTDVQENLTEVRERVIRIEAQEFKQEIAALQLQIEILKESYGRELEKLKDKILKLEYDKAARGGAVALASWVSANAPWLGAVLMALAIYFGVMKRG